MDFKRAVDPRNPFELAKDVAAFANNLGGTIVVGAEEQKGLLFAYFGLADSELAIVKQAFCDAVKDRCYPLPLYDLATAEVTGGRALAVNVWPAIAQVVSVRVASDKTKGFGGDAFVFPRRSGANTQYITPEKLSMFMVPEARRAAVLIASIPQAALIRVRVRNHNNGYEDHQCELVKVDEERNLVRLKSIEGPRHQIQLPLDQVQTVYEVTEGGPWQLVLHPHRS